MIQNKKDLKYYIIADQLSLGGGGKTPLTFITNPIINFQYLLRKCEYYKNCRKDALGRLAYYLLRTRFERMSSRLGLTIPLNVFGPGLSIAHYGSVVVNSHTKVGKNCRIHSGVNIGIGESAPTIGDNVYIGPGAKIWGKISIGDNVAIGANAVVNKDIPSGVTVAGVPAKIVSQKGSFSLINDGCKLAIENLEAERK